MFPGNAERAPRSSPSRLCSRRATARPRAAPAPAASAPARPRPAPEADARYYLARNADRCEIYSVDGGGSRAAGEPLARPISQPGESFRIAGKTCIRESPDPMREMPVVCPDPLTNEEKKDRKAAASATARSSYGPRNRGRARAPRRRGSAGLSRRPRPRGRAP